MNMQLPSRPKLDVPRELGTMPVHVQECDVSGAVPRHPTLCAIGKAGSKSGFTMFVMGSIVYVLRPAVRELITYNRGIGNPHVKNVSVGDLVLWRYSLSRPDRTHVDRFDHGAGFPDTYVTLRPPNKGERINRDKRSATRRSRVDNHAAGKRPQYRRKPPRLDRYTRTSAILRGEEAA